MNYTMLIAVYVLNTILIAGYLWLEYLDVRTTMKDVTNGAIESNPAMVPYVKAGDPWLMWRGKIKNGMWSAFVAILVPPITVFLAWKAISLFQAVRGNETLATSGKIK